MTNLWEVHRYSQPSLRLSHSVPWFLGYNGITLVTLTLLCGPICEVLREKPWYTYPSLVQSERYSERAMVHLPFSVVQSERYSGRTLAMLPFSWYAWFTSE